MSCCRSDSSTTWMLRKSKYTVRFTLRPFPFCIPFQFWNESSTKVCGVTVMMVLSKLRIFTVVSVISSTIPSAPAFGTVIQSPLCSISLLVRRIPATSPLMVSWNTSIRMADVAPSPANSFIGSLSMMIDTTMMAATKIINRRSTPMNE